jgi:hypothetical protein
MLAPLFHSPRLLPAMRRKISDRPTVEPKRTALLKYIFGDLELFVSISKSFLLCMNGLRTAFISAVCSWPAHLRACNVYTKQ